ncbi:hypothetical protein Clacol_008416 [Clathrus columnatus]|uniref:non-specific serine/threonine protein kinase n=1 Tax=Clathrus columnatus TaxID=1419009 RepID=A0AAV5AMM1_9AGAM|nr:hypothetical protein Clacol_008416 [Clathrus columnatus]
MTLKDVLDSLTPISQGAEAGYRHPTLDSTLTKGRITGEARMLLKCLRSNVCVPGLRLLDIENGILGLEWIDGTTVRNLLQDTNDEEDSDSIPQAMSLSDYNWTTVTITTSDDLMKEIGIQLAMMHMSDIIHGDLTTSNMMIRLSLSSKRAELLLIDFGLSYVSNLIEDKAVDLYVLERAFASTYPDSEPLFNKVLEAYGTHSGKIWTSILKRLEQVRLRGLKQGEFTLASTE